jgi:hypothetical protein
MEKEKAAHDTATCHVCQLQKRTIAWAAYQMPGFFKNRAEWIAAEVRKYEQRGVAQKDMGTINQIDGTCYFVVNRKKVSCYEVAY